MAQGTYTDADLAAPSKSPPTGTSFTDADVATTPPPAKVLGPADLQTPAKTDLDIGFRKGLDSTVIGLGELVHKIPGVSAAIDAFYGTPGLSAAAFPTAKKAAEATNTAQSIGKGAEQLGEFFLPTGIGGKLGKLAEVIKAGVLTSAQTGSLTAGGVSAALTGGIGAVAPKLADMVEGSANKSMIRALGPAGGSGPTAPEHLTAAENIAPDLVKAGFKPTSQVQARVLAAKAVTKAGDDLKATLAQFGNAPGDTVALEQAIAAKRAALRVPAAGGGTVLDSSSQAADAIWEKLESDVKSLEPTAGAMHALKNRWNNQIANWATDPTGARAIYQAGGDLIRAQMSGNHREIAEADKLFHFSSQLSDIVNAPTVRRPGAGLAATVAPFALPTVGAAVGGTAGYRQGGVGGAAAGAVAGAATVAGLSSLIASPGFRYLSAAMKNALANALDSGDGKRIAQLVAGATAQAARLATAKGDGQ